MEFPGIRKETIQELDPEKQKAIRNHIKAVEELVQKKEGLVKNKDPNEKLLAFQGFAQIDKYQELYKGDLGTLLQELEEQTNTLTKAITEEIRLVKEISRMASASDKDDTLKADMETLKSEIKDDMIIGTLLRGQQHALDEIHSITSKIAHLASKEFPELGEYAAEFDIIRSLLDNIITDEFPVLDLIYNLANIPGSATETPSEVE